MAALRIILVIAAVVTLSSCQERRFSNYGWAVKVPYNSTVKIDCVLMINATAPLVSKKDLAVLAWYAPDGTEIPRGHSHLKIMGDSDDVLEIHNVQKEDSGVYMCKFRNDDGMTRFHKHGLNLSGPLYATQFEQYKQNLIIGGSAAGAMLGLVSIGCIVHTLVSKSKES